VSVKTAATHESWQVTSRINRAGNLAIEIELAGSPHAELILQEDGTLDLGTKARPWELGEAGWDMPGAPSSDLRKFRFSA
jgi:hypothetical protein